MSTIYRLQFLLIAAAAILATAFPANAQTTLEAVKQKGVLVAGSSAEYPPFEYVADGKLVGYDVDMAEEITRRMGVKVAWEKIDFKGIVAALTAKRVDVLITALTWTPERAERIAFSDPYFDAGIGAITPRSSTIEKAEDLTGRKVGVQLGSSGERYVREAGYNRWADTNALIVLYPQAIKRYSPFVFSPRGCWDWWGYSSANYHTKSAPQLRAVMQMLERLAE